MSQLCLFLSRLSPLVCAAPRAHERAILCAADMCVVLCVCLCPFHNLCVRGGCFTGSSRQTTKKHHAFDVISAPTTAEGVWTNARVNRRRDAALVWKILINWRANPPRVCLNVCEAMRDVRARHRLTRTGGRRHQRWHASCLIEYVQL